MVPPPTPQMRAQDPSLIVVEPYKELPVDRRGFVGPVPEIVGLEPADNFAVYTARKLYIHNCGHAMLGYLGHLRGHDFGTQALEDAAIRPLFERALAESKHGIATAHGVDPAWLEAHIGDITRRLANHALGDTIFRLAHDPLAVTLQQRIAAEGLAVVLAGVSGIEPDEPLAALVRERYRRLQAGAWP